MLVSTNVYVTAFKELIDEVIRGQEQSQRAKELIINEVLREAEKVFKP